MGRELTPDKIMQIAIGFMSPKTLLSAIELGVFTELAKGPQDGESLRTHLDLHPRGARDFLDALVSLGMLQRKNGQYANTPESDRPKNHDSYLPARQKAGLKEKYVLRNIDDPNEVITLFELEDVPKAREFFDSADLRAGMQQAGTADRPDFYLLSD